MNKVAIFGNAGAGKSTLAKQLANATGLPLYSLDKLQFRVGGAPVPQEEFLAQHQAILQQDQWIIDGFGGLEAAWQRFAQADTLVYIDLPLWRHAWWISKRLLKGLFVTPEGWPDKSPMLKSTWTSYKVLWLCHRKLTPAYRKLVQEQSATKTVYHLTTSAEIRCFLKSLKR